MAPKKLGLYLVDDQLCDAKAVADALQLQAELASQGTYQSTGQIMVEGGHITPEDLKNVLHRQWMDILGTTDLFKSLTDNLMIKIAEVAEDRVFPQHTIIFQQGDPGDAFWLIITGRVRIFRPTEEGAEITLAELEPGECFGEMALLTGEPRSASVETLLPTRFLAIPKNNFDRVVETTPELSVAFAKILADRLTRSDKLLAKASVTERAYQRFVSEYQAGPQLELTGRSPLIKKLRNQIARAAENDMPIWITGPPGTEKRSVAWQIHQASVRRDNPFLIIDAQTVTIGQQDAPGRGPDAMQLELAQDSTLFGHLQNALPFAKNSRLGLLQVGNNGTVVIENIDHLAASVQAKLSSFIRKGYFRPLGRGEKITSSVRIIACTSTDLADLAREDLFHSGLYVLLAQQTLDIPPLKRRKKDLRHIVDYLVSHYSGQTGKTLAGVDKEAYNDIMAYGWPGNMDELEVVIRRGVNLAKDDYLAHDHIFIGPAAPVSGKVSFNLLKLEWFRNLFKSQKFPGLAQLTSGLFFALIFYLGFWGSQDPDQNIALVLTWGIWEPMVIFSTLVAARIWCGLCPVGGLCSLINRFTGLNRSIPQFLRRYGFYLSGAGLGIIIWAEVASDMTFSPRATGMLILAITAPALLMALIFQRRAWCRYVCPLGKLVGVLSSTSILELRANYGICNNDCTAHSCYAGGKHCEDGCPMFEGPFSLRSNQDCILCGNCIKNCQNHSPQLNVRLPGQEIWAALKPDKIIVFMVPVLMGVQIFRGLAESRSLQRLATTHDLQPVILLAALAIITLLTHLFIRTAETLTLARPIPGEKEQTGILAHALLFLAAAAEIGFHLGRVLERAGQLLPILGRQLGLDLEAYGIHFPAWSIKTLQVTIILAGIWAAAAVLKKIQTTNTEADAPLPLLWRWPILLPGVFYIFLFLTW